MFTGIVEELGEVVGKDDLDSSARFTIRGPLVTADAGHGDSIAVNGVCLTVVELLSDGRFTADVMGQTLAVSAIADLAEGDEVNLERAAQVGDRLAGHIVQGHVDSTGILVALDSVVSPSSPGFDKQTTDWTLKVRVPENVRPWMVPKGSVAIEGISLTIAHLTDDYFEIAIIPKTFEVTNFSQLAPGDAVNLEADVIAKYVERILTEQSRNVGIT